MLNETGRDNNKINTPRVVIAKKRQFFGFYFSSIRRPGRSSFLVVRWNQASRWIEIFLMAAYKSADNPTDEFSRGMQMNRGGKEGRFFLFSQDTCKIYLMV